MEGTTSLIASALSNIPTIFNSAMTMITGNEVAMVYVGIPLIGAGIGLFRSLTSRRR